MRWTIPFQNFQSFCEILKFRTVPQAGAEFVRGPSSAKCNNTVLFGLLYSYAIKVAWQASRLGGKLWYFILKG
jgi:hypothetical protein